MIDIQAELSKLEEEWNSKFISIHDLMICLKGNNSTLTFSGIAKFLFARLKDFNLSTLNVEDYPDIFSSNKWRSDYEIEPEFTNKYGIPCYSRMVDGSPRNLTFKESNLFFNFLFEIKNGFFSKDLKIPLDEFDFDFAYINTTYIEKRNIEEKLGIALSTTIATNEKNPNIKSTINDNELATQLTAKDEEIARLKAEIIALKQQAQSATQGNEPTQGRISQPQRDLLTLLVMNCYGERQSRNDLFNAINADLRAKGIRTREIKYSTFDKLIDDEIRINNKSPFPPKQK